MAAENFPRALSLVLKHEGGWSNHPDDPGGPTMRGIIQRVYDGYRRGKGLPTRSVREISNAELEEIYRRQYWDAVRADELPEGIDYVVFDGAVNSGPAQSAKWLQRALGVQADGAIGASTIAAAKAIKGRASIIDDICDRRLAMLKALKTWPVFGRGWAARVADVRRNGKAWAIGVTHTAAVRVETVAEKAEESAKAPPSSAAAPPDPTKGASAVAGGVLASSVSEAARQVEPYAGSSKVMSAVFTGLTVLGLVLMAGGLLYVWWSARAAKRQAAALDLPTAG